MAGWSEVAAEQPELAAAVRAAFTVRKHCTMATLRRDGSPRISGTEVTFDDGTGQLVLGMMPGSLKARDLLRDPRLAVHSPTVDPPEDDPSTWSEAKVAGLAVPLAAGPGDAGHAFAVDLTEVVLTRVGRPADHLTIDSWHPGRGLQRRRRA